MALPAAPDPAGWAALGAAGPVQARGTLLGDPDEAREVAARGLRGAASPLPHGDAIRRSFGAHDVSSVRARVGGDAAEAAQSLGAVAYASGDAAAFAEAPDLHTAAHEAAHIVQQRAGVSLAGGLGQPGDRYEQQADAVADLVVRGLSAEPLLDGLGGRAGVDGAVQRKSAEEEPEGERTLPPGVDVLVEGTRDSPTLLIRKSWLRAQVKLGDKARFTGDRTLMRRLVAEVNEHLQLGLGPETLDAAAGNIGLTLGAPVGKLPEVIESRLSRSLYATTGLASDTPILAYTERSTPPKGKEQVTCTVLISEALLSGAGVKDRGAPVRPRELNARIADAIAAAFGRPILPQSWSLVVELVFGEGGARLSQVTPGTRSLHFTHADCERLFGVEGLAEWLAREPGESGAGGGAGAGPGVSPRDARWAAQFLRDNFAGAGGGGARTIDRDLVEALRRLEAHPDKAAIIGSLTGGDGGPGQLTAHSLDEAMREHDLAKRREAAGLERKPEPAADGRRPVRDTPVQGEIVCFSEPLVPNKESRFWFQTERLADSLRAAILQVEWKVWDPAGAPVREKVRRYQEDDRSETFDLEFSSPGTYRVYCYVTHSYYRESDFERVFEVRAEQVVQREQEETEYRAMGGRPQTIWAQRFDTGLDNEIAGPRDYSAGRTGRGTLPEEFYEQHDEYGDLETLGRSIEEIDALIERYGTSRDPNERAIARHAEKTRAEVSELLGGLGALRADPHNVFFRVRAVYTSRTAGLRSGALSIIGVYDPRERAVTLKDYSFLADQEVTTADGAEGSFDKSVREAFTDLAKDYPDGSISFLVERLSDKGTPDGETLYLALKTDSVWKDVKGTVFDPALDIVVNLAATIALVFPPTAAAGAAVLLTYNTARTAGQLLEWADKGTLDFEKGGIALGQLLLDVMPAAGRVQALTKVGKRTMFAIHSAELGGQVWLISAQASAQIAHLRDGVVHSLSAIETEIRQIQATRPWDPRLQALKEQRDGLKKRFEESAGEAIRPLVTTGGIMLVAGGIIGKVEERALTPRFSRLEADGSIVKVKDGPPIRYDAESGRIHVNEALEVEVSQAALEQAVRARDLDRRLAKQAGQPARTPNPGPDANASPRTADAETARGADAETARGVDAETARGADAETTRGADAETTRGADTVPTADLPKAAPKYRTWNQFQAGTKGQFKNRTEAAKAWRLYRQANGVSTAPARSAGARRTFLRSMAHHKSTPKWMRPWLKKGKVPPGYEVDHIKPLSAGGADEPSNMRLQGADIHKTHHRYYRPWE